jgi:hypothetical protein
VQARREADLPLEPLRAERLGQLRMQHLERDRAIMAQVLGEIDRGHASAPELTLDGVAARKGGLELLADRGQGGNRLKAKG